MAIEQAKRDSILLSIKHKLGCDGIDNYDQDIIMDINTALMKCQQIGVGPKEGFAIEDETATWFDFIGNSKNLEAVKTLVYLETKLIFDPPSTGTLQASCEKMISEYTWRLNAARENETGGNL